MFGMSGAQPRGMPLDVIADESLDEEIAVIVAFVPAHFERLPGLAARLFQKMRMELAREELVREPLVDEDRHAERATREELRRIVLEPAAAILAQVAAERLLAPWAAARGRDGRERRKRLVLLRMTMGERERAVPAHRVAEDPLTLQVRRKIRRDH